MLTWEKELKPLEPLGRNYSQSFNLGFWAPSAAVHATRVRATEEEYGGMWIRFLLLHMKKSVWVHAALKHLERETLLLLIRSLLITALLHNIEALILCDLMIKKLSKKGLSL